MEGLKVGARGERQLCSRLSLTAQLLSYRGATGHPKPRACEILAPMDLWTLLARPALMKTELHLRQQSSAAALMKTE